MKRLILLVCLFLLPAGGCTSLPGHELNNARQSLANARAAGANELAETEYLAAKAALSTAEKLVRQGEYQAAREWLPFATEQARQASLQAIAIKRELARQQARLAEADRNRLEQQAQQTPQHQLKSLSTPIAKKRVTLLSSYHVTTEESLWEIASRDETYADGTLWPLLYKANRDQIKDPRKVYPGQTLAIPRGASQQELDAARHEAAESEFFSPMTTAISNRKQL